MRTKLVNEVHDVCAAFEVTYSPPLSLSFPLQTTENISINNHPYQHGEHKFHATSSGLAQELFDHILSYVVHVPIPEPQSDVFRYRRITSAHKYPTASRLNKFYRTKFAQQFFDNTVLVFSSVRVFHKYAMTLAPDFLKHIMTMHAVYWIRFSVTEDQKTTEIQKRLESLTVKMSIFQEDMERLSVAGEFVGYAGTGDEVLVVAKDSNQEWVGNWPEAS